ncbi:glycoside hydrolase family 127 protein [Haloferula sp. A504]|uniref:glycoside hydrolase family 127 protein n=1 Tax=Haloferula sp. A504 TaxID=3373601 RepID=UPI0031C7A497|nr:glycoside hydrolase family 127 protein [Verrucomicrobiaceae bacterium E54]
MPKPGAILGDGAGSPGHIHVRRPRSGGRAVVGATFLILTSAAASGEPLRPAGVADVSVEGGFWGPRIDTNATVTLPHNLEFIEKTGRMGAFDRAAGKPTDGTDNPVSVVDSDVHKILEGAAYTLQVRPDEVDADEIARKVARVIAAQEKDGFLCPRLTVDETRERWEDLRKSHVLYSAGHLFESGVAWKQATGKNDLLEASARFADLIDKRFGPDGVHDVPGHQEIEMALIRLHQATGEKRYLDLCRFFLDQRGHVHGGTERVRGPKPRSADYNQDRVPLKEATEAVGHAVRATYTYAAMADVARICPDHGYDHALDALWEDVVARKLYLTGASASAQFYDEGFGDPYVLPNADAYGETCGTIGTALWAHRMTLLRADARYADIMERALYNGVLSGISISGDKFFYKNPLASRGGVVRHPSWNPACCQSNLVRIIPQVGSMAYATRGNTIFVNLFVNGTASLQLPAGEFRFRVETEYPHDGRVRFVVEEAPDDFVTLAIRIPGWARGTPVSSKLYRFIGEPDTHNRIADAMVDDDGYFRLIRNWADGEVYDLPLPMAVRRVIAHEGVQANRGRVALQRGPLVYCVEAVDHAGQRTDAIVLPDGAKLSTEQRDDLLGGMTVVTADAEIAKEPAWGKAAELEPIKLTAIPYYAWANRGEGYMDVWLARTAEAATPLPAATAAHEASLAASVKSPTKAMEAVRDGRSGPTSDHRPTPCMTLPDTGDGPGWIEYRWDEPRKLSRAAVYWAVDRRAQVYWGPRIRGEDLVMPESWKLTYYDGSKWIPVETEDPFTLRLDLFNEVDFKPVETTALRLEVEFGPAPAAVQEWRVD